MSSRRFVRLLGAALALVVGLGVTACSDDDSGGGASEGNTPDTESYCDAVRAGFEIIKSAPITELSDEQIEQFTRLWMRANEQAPEDLRDDYLLMLNGDSYAAENISFYNESECGVDSSQLPGSATTAP